MDGVHDLGGVHGFGPVDRSQEEHWPDEWERKVFALTLACGMQGKWNLDESRFAREQMEPAHYLASSYYEHWLHGLELLLVKKGLVSTAELANGKADPPSAHTPVGADRVPDILGTGAPTRLDEDQPAEYAVGDLVRICNDHPRHHTRMPRYIRGRTGTVIMHHGAHIFPDTHAGRGEKVARHLYTVEFTGDELWGTDHDSANMTVCIDVFEPYIACAA